MMSLRSSLTRDLSESVKTCLGSNVKVTMKCMVRLEIKTDKFENRVLAFSACRLFILTAKVPTRLDHHFHYLNIQAIESKNPNQFVVLLNEGKRYCFGVFDERHNEIDAMIINLGVSIKNIFPSVPLNHVVRRLDVVPAHRINKLYEVCRVIEARDPGACGGFSAQYVCMCDFHSLPCRDEVAWDVDTIYASHDCRELNLRDFEHLDSKDMVPIISALEHNTWFTSLRASHMRLHGDALEQILHVLAQSVSLQHLHLDNAALKSEIVQRLCSAVLSNTNSVLNSIDLSHNNIEDKGVCHLASAVTKWQRHSSGSSLQRLCVAHCGVGARGASQLCQALSAAANRGAPLTHLDLSGNTLRDECTALTQLLAKSCSLRTLTLSNCELTLDLIFGALLRGCLSQLVELDLSYNSFSSKKSRELPAAFKQFFTSAAALKHIKLVSCKITQEALKHLLLGLACNESLCDVTLDISANNLASTGAHVMESCVHGVRCLHTLNIADNGFEQELAGLLAAVNRNRSVRVLNVSHNMTQLKPKHMRHVVDALVQLVQDEECTLESLDISDSRLKSELYPFLNALGSNNCLQFIDISGNMMGDTGARLLAKALQINSRLRHITLDHNNIAVQGLSDIAYSLQSNCTLSHIATPLSDLAAAGVRAGVSDRVEVVWRRIEQLLHRNTQQHRPPTRQAFKLQQGFLLSSTQQMIDRLVSQIRCHTQLNNYPTTTTTTTTPTVAPVTTPCEAGCNPPSSSEPEETGTSRSESMTSVCDGSVTSQSEQQQLIQHAEAVCEDAERCKQLLARFHSIVMEQECSEAGVDAANSNNAGTAVVDKILSTVVDDIHSVIMQHTETVVDRILSEAGTQCPHVLAESVQRQIHSACMERARQSRDSTRQLIVQSAGHQLAAQLSQLQLAVATQLSDRVIDEVVANLLKSHRTLIGESSLRRRTSTCDVLKSSRSLSRLVEDTTTCSSSSSSTLNTTTARDHCTSNTTNTHQAELSPPYLDYLNLATPQMQAKIHRKFGRKMRPNSVADKVDGVCADQLTEVLDEQRTPLETVQELETVCELNASTPFSNVDVSSRNINNTSNIISSTSAGDGKLHHLGLSRPRRAKARAPSRAPLTSPSSSTIPPPPPSYSALTNDDYTSDTARSASVDAGMSDFFTSPLTTSKLAEVPRANRGDTTAASDTTNSSSSSLMRRADSAVSVSGKLTSVTDSDVSGEPTTRRERRVKSIRKGLSSVLSKFSSSSSSSHHSCAPSSSTDASVVLKKSSRFHRVDADKLSAQQAPSPAQNTKPPSSTNINNNNNNSGSMAGVGGDLSSNCPAPAPTISSANSDIPCSPVSALSSQTDRKSTATTAKPSSETARDHEDCADSFLNHILSATSACVSSTASSAISSASCEAADPPPASSVSSSTTTTTTLPTVSSSASPPSLSSSSSSCNKMRRPHQNSNNNGGLLSGADLLAEMRSKQEKRNSNSNINSNINSNSVIDDVDDVNCSPSHVARGRPRAAPRSLVDHAITDQDTQDEACKSAVIRASAGVSLRPPRPVSSSSSCSGETISNTTTTTTTTGKNLDNNNSTTGGASGAVLLSSASAVLARWEKRRSRRITASEMENLDEGCGDGPRSLPSIYVSAERRSIKPPSSSSSSCGPPPSSVTTSSSPLLLSNTPVAPAKPGSEAGNRRVGASSMFCSEDVINV